MNRMEKRDKTLFNSFLTLIIVIIVIFIGIFIYHDLMLRDDRIMGEDFCEKRGLKHFETLRVYSASGGNELLKISCFDTSKQESIIFERLR